MRWLAVALMVLAVGPGGGFAHAAAPETREDVWEGQLKVRQGVELRLVIHAVKNAGGALTGSLDSPDQGANGLKLDEIAIDGTTLKFRIGTLNASYEGKLNAAGNEAEGTFEQAGVKLALKLRKTDRPAGGKIVGKEQIWEGKLSLGAGLSLRIALHVGKDEKGDTIATFDSLDQGAKGLPVSSIAINDKTLTFELKSLGGKFEGKLNATGDEATGTWRQGAAELPLTLKKTEKLSTLKRPQTPRGPFPYRSEDVTYQNAAGGVTLAATLTLPQGAGPFPAVILISGSGAQDRDETLFEHKPFLVLADTLTRRGLAVLRVDDRGVGGSTGKIATSTSDDFAGDVLAGVAYLKSRKEIAPQAIGLLGHSEGGIIAPIVASRAPEIAFIVLLAGTGLPGDAILERQGQLILKVNGADEETLRWQREAQKTLIAIVKSESDPKVIRAKAEEVSKQLVATMPASIKPKDESTDGSDAARTLANALRSLETPWFRYFLTYDPRPTLEKVRCPVLALVGEKDLQVEPKENLAAIESAIKKGGNTDVTALEVPGVNHLFQTCETGAPGEYAAIEETIAPAALRTIGDWITRHLPPPVK